ncbi:MAG: hypothetical protein AAB932_05680, partial [Patescibacteria group bacterium]
DYYNIFQNYEDEPRGGSFLTANGRVMSGERAGRTLLLYWWSAAGVILLVAGFIAGAIRVFHEENKKDSLPLEGRVRERSAVGGVLFLYILTFGFLAALLYNTYQYPFLERGTMKAIFILSFFPLFALLGVQGLASTCSKFSLKRYVAVAGGAYGIVWCAISISAVVL